MEEEWALPAPIRLMIAQMAHLDEVSQLGHNDPLPANRWLGYGLHIRNKLWWSIRPPLVVWCNCSKECYGEKTKNKTDIEKMIHTRTIKWRMWSRIETYALVLVESTAQAETYAPVLME